MDPYTPNHNEMLQSPKTTLIPLSKDPILLVSSKPLLSLDECNTLIDTFSQSPSERSNEACRQTAHLLDRLQEEIQELTGCPWHEGEALVPRFLHYNNPQQHDDSSQLFPDGLHVDTNNGKLFRYVTCLLYLTTNNDGATSFPLAKPLKQQQQELSVEEKTLVQASKDLLDSGVTHTFDKKRNVFEQCELLEQAGEALLLHDDDESTLGLRILPRAGMLCVFCNVLPNGKADPRSFHGGEANNMNESKALFTYFKEVPLQSFSSQAEFGKRVEETRNYLLKRYYHND